MLCDIRTGQYIDCINLSNFPFKNITFFENLENLKKIIKKSVVDFWGFRS